MIKVLNLENAPLSDRNGSYGGAAGSKEGILIDREYWLVKYPKSTRSMRGTLLSYTTSALSEYIGSHIYSILGYSVHETKLGIRNGKLVVACKDFCEYPGELREIRTLKNIYNDKLESMLESEAGTVSDTHSVALKEILLQLEYNPILSKVLGLKDRFWDLVIIDGLSIITTGTMETGVCCIEKMLIRSRLYLITALHFPIKQQMNRWQHV